MEAKSLVSKEFACPVLYFERLANLMSKEVRPVNSMSNIEISLQQRPGDLARIAAAPCFAPSKAGTRYCIPLV